MAEAYSNGWKVFAIARNPYFPRKRTGKYDINVGKGYIGAMVNKNNDHYYYLLDFGKIKSRYYG